MCEVKEPSAWTLLKYIFYFLSTYVYTSYRNAVNGKLTCVPNSAEWYSVAWLTYTVTWALVLYPDTHIILCAGCTTRWAHSCSPYNHLCLYLRVQNLALIITGYDKRDIIWCQFLFSEGNIQCTCIYKARIQFVMRFGIITERMNGTKVLNPRRCIYHARTREICMREHEKYACSTDTHAVQIRSYQLYENSKHTG